MDVKKKISCDVLVVGGGNAGLCAAIEAKNRGVKPLLIEKGPIKTRGGNSRLAGSVFRIAYPGGTKDFEPLIKQMQLPKGKIEIEPYTKDEFYNKVMKITDGLADKRLTEIVVNKSLETILWMNEQGVRWELTPDGYVKQGDTLFWPSGPSVIRSPGSGEGLMEDLYKAAEKRGIEILYETAAESLLTNADAKVCGVVAKDLNGYLQIDAKNVILSCGGFQANPAWRRRYLGPNWDLVKLRGTRYNTGEGITMAVAVGAQLTGHWGGCHASVVSEDSPMVEAATGEERRYSYPYSIMVNREGNRFLDEGNDLRPFTYSRFGREILVQPDGIAFQIFDAKTIPLLLPLYQDKIKVESNSLKELAEEININVDQFLSTIKTYNAAVQEDKPFVKHRLDGRRTQGLNPDKTNWAQKIDTPPYRAYAVVCGLTMTYGGLKANEKAQVIDTADHPIKGLYAVGEVTGGFFYHNYGSGNGLTRGAVMGRIAGGEAAANCAG